MNTLLSNDESNTDFTLSTLYKQLLDVIQQHVQQKQNQIQLYQSQTPPAQNILEKETKDTIILYEIILMLGTLSTSFKKVFQNFQEPPTVKKVEQQLLDILPELKSLWEKEIKKNLQDKASLLLDEITRKEQDIKKAIDQRQKEIQAFAEQVTFKAQQAQSLKLKNG